MLQRRERVEARRLRADRAWRAVEIVRAAAETIARRAAGRAADAAFLVHHLAMVRRDSAREPRVQRGAFEAGILQILARFIRKLLLLRAAQRAFAVALRSLVHRELVVARLLLPEL